MTDVSRGSYASHVMPLVCCLALAGFPAAGPEGVHLFPTASAMELAQAGDSGTPLRLRPRRDLSAPIVPDSPDPDREGPVDPRESPPPEIEVRDLGEVDPDSVGTIDRSEGGLGWDMWLGTPRALIEHLLPQLPAELRSPTMQDLARRLLLSVAALPPPGEQQAERQTGPSILALRAERLQAMGMIDDVADLLRLAPRAAEDPDLLRLRVDNLLLAHNLGGACSEIRNAGDHLLEPYWQETLVFCQLLAGDQAAARLGLRILADRNGSPAFLALADRIGGNEKVVVERLPSPSPLHLAMARSANVTLPKDVLETASPAILRTIALSPNAELELRLEAAEQAASVGAISIDRLAGIYSSVEFSEHDMNNALSVAGEWRDARGRALLYNAAQRHTVPAARAAVIQKALELAHEDDRLGLTEKLYRRHLMELPISAELAWFAPDAARALLGMAERDAARPWVSLLRQRAYRDDEAKAALTGLWALALLAGDESVRIEDRDAFVAWAEAVRRGDDGESAYDRAAFGLLLLEAAGADISGAYWQHLLDKPLRREVVEPPVAFNAALRHAAAAGRRAETVLLALVTAGSYGPARPSPATMRESIAALKSAGFVVEAQSIALEMAVEAGL